MKKMSSLGLIILAVVFGVVAVIYFTKTAGSLPHFFPGYLKGSTRTHLKHAVVAVVLVMACLLGAWMVSGSDKKSGVSSEI